MIKTLIVTLSDDSLDKLLLVLQDTMEELWIKDDTAEENQVLYVLSSKDLS